MKFPYSMLLDFVQTSLTADEVGDLLTMAGFELEGIEEVEGEPVLDMKVMSNRGDGLSVFGLSREVLAKDLASKPTDLYKRAAARFAAEGLSHTAENPAKVSIETADCGRYACRYWDSVPTQEAPEWIQSRLRKAGMRSISLTVDLTNYVMLELGQPLHSFDFDKLEEGKIVVRGAKAGEKLATLDGGEHELRPDQMMICDANRPVAVAGVMGGENSEIGGTTKRMLLESAHFNGISVRRTRKQLGLNTEASYRFERSVDPEGVVAAIERYSELLGVTGSKILDVYPGKTSFAPVAVRVSRAVKMLGMEITVDEARAYLERLGLEVSGSGEPFMVTPPSWRPDLVREIDFVEELGRVHGFERIPEANPKGTTTLGGPRGDLLQIDRLREAFVRGGFVQTISHSLRDVHPLDASECGGERVKVRTPSSPDTAYLRNSLLPSLADAAQRNGGRELHLVEVGKVFAKQGDYVERASVAVLSTGDLLPADRKGEVLPTASFYSLKGSVEEALAQASLQVSFVEATNPDARFHPTRQADLLAGGKKAGVLGQVHPDIAEDLKLPAGTVLAELDLTTLLEFGQKDISLRSISRNPAVRRDIALLIDKAVAWEKIEQAIRASAGEVLERLWLFDVYTGANLPEGKHSLGIALQLRKSGENFTDEAANLVRETVVSALGALGGTTR